MNRADFMLVTKRQKPSQLDEVGDGDWDRDGDGVEAKVGLEDSEKRNNPCELTLMVDLFTGTSYR